MNRLPQAARWRALPILVLLALLIPFAPAATPLRAAPDAPSHGPGLHHLIFVDINGPAGSEAFGTHVVTLTNGNVVITDPLFDAAGVPNVGAVYLYQGQTRRLISVTTGSTAEDRVGSAGVVALANGNLAFSSPLWDNGGAVNAGAVTWCSGITGCADRVSAANSLVGSTSGDMVGNYPALEIGGPLSPILALRNGNYVVRTPTWDNGSATNVGAVTWGNGETGVVGPISTQNSLVGTKAGDQVGNYFIFGLKNGNYLTFSTLWDNSSTVDVGAITWGDGTTGITGQVSTQNSIVGQSAGDVVGNYGYRELANGHYVIFSPNWGGTRGAITWANGSQPSVGTISAQNSLVGSSATDYLGMQGVVGLQNGNYVIPSPSWSNGAINDAGAVTWANGSQPIVGTISAQNSLVGSVSGDQVGSGTRHGGLDYQGYYVHGGITPLENSNYVVTSPYWNNAGLTDAGAVTWGDGTQPLIGTISSQNSLVGSTLNDRLGSIPNPTVGQQGVTALTNGNFVVRSVYWDNTGIADAGAATWGDGTQPLTGTISAQNSLVGTKTSDRVGSYAVRALTNGNYVVSSPLWTNAGNNSAGAVTWGAGTDGITGSVSAQNSLVGSSGSDMVGNAPVEELASGSYLINSPSWNNGGINDTGAITWASGTGGITGTISAQNSLVGTTANDWIGKVQVLPLSNGRYVMANSWWNNGASSDAGAITWGDDTQPLSGNISDQNSLIGSSAVDQLGSGMMNGGSPSNGLHAFENGYFAIISPYWDTAATADAGLVTFIRQDKLHTGAPPLRQSVLGRSSSAGATMFTAYNAYNENMLVSTPADNRVTFVILSHLSMPIFMHGGEEIIEEQPGTGER